MMLTKEECKQALEHIKTLRGSNYGGYYSGFNNSALPFDEDINVISKLIEEHFEDKNTLKERFKGYEGETSKEDPWDDLYEGLKKRIEEQARKEVKDV